MDHIRLLIVCVLWVLVGYALSQEELSAADKKELLDVHNQLRSSVKPPATNMQTMTWSDELAQAAQHVAAQCGNTNSQSMGENIITTTASSANYTASVKSWYSERENYDYNSGQCSAKCDNYKQVVWAASKKLGCGAHTCEHHASDKNATVIIRIIVCHYKPAGNAKGQKPYKSAHGGLHPSPSTVLFFAVITALLYSIATQ